MTPANRPLLGVCIPTHHGRAARLAELLDRLVPQIPPDGSVEICISDNASRDGTSELVAGRQAMLGDRLRYRRADSDRGLAENLFAVVEMASAEYCWLMGSDDAPAAEAVPRLVALLRANPGVSGVHLGFFRRAADDLDAPGVDCPPHLLPSEARPMRFRSLEGYVEECGVLPVFLSMNVVHRNRWRAVVAAERESATRTPIVPQVYVMGRMMQGDRDWLWSEDRLVLSREAPVFLAEDRYIGVKGGDLAPQWRAVTANLNRVWIRLYGRGSQLHRSLMRDFGRFMMHPAAATQGKLMSADRFWGEFRQLAFARHFWRDREFQRKTLPILLTPTWLFRVPENASPLTVEAPEAHLHGRVPERLLSGRGAWIEVLVENIGRKPLSFARPYHAVLSARWTTPESGETVEDRMYNTPLYPPVLPGRSRRLKQLVTVPSPGRYALTLDLYSRRGFPNLTGFRALTGEVNVELPVHIEISAPSPTTG